MITPLCLRFGKVHISAWAIIAAAAVLYSDFSFFTVEVLLAAAIHEAGHLAAMKLFRVNIYSVTVLPYGAVICSDASLLPYKKEAAVSLSGILFNLMTAAASLTIWIFSRDLYTLFFSACSIFLALVNLIPVPTLDGARAIEAILSEYCGNEKKAEIMDTVYYFAFLALVLLSLFVLEATNGNFSLVIFLCYIFVCIYAKKA